MVVDSGTHGSDAEAQIKDRQTPEVERERGQLIPGEHRYITDVCQDSEHCHGAPCHGGRPAF